MISSLRVWARSFVRLLVLLLVLAFLRTGHEAHAGTCRQLFASASASKSARASEDALIVRGELDPHNPFTAEVNARNEIRRLGYGYSGSVYRLTDRASGKMQTIKRFTDPQDLEDQLRLHELLTPMIDPRGPVQLARFERISLFELEVQNILGETLAEASARGSKRAEVASYAFTETLRELKARFDRIEGLTTKLAPLGKGYSLTVIFPDQQTWLWLKDDNVILSADPRDPYFLIDLF